VTIAKRPSYRVRDARKNARDLPDITSENACDTLARRANHLVIPEAGQLSGIHLSRRLVAKWIPGPRLPRKIASLFCRDGASRNNDSPLILRDAACVAPQDEANI
jgi:hypothetical protein